MAKTAESTVEYVTPDRLSPVMDDLRRDDRDRYLTALLAPSQAREGLLAVYGFNLELSLIHISEPTRPY